jgi:hypothetical protein
MNVYTALFWINSQIKPLVQSGRIPVLYVELQAKFKSYIDKASHCFRPL